MFCHHIRDIHDTVQFEAFSPIHPHNEGIPQVHVQKEIVKFKVTTNLGI